MFTAKYKGINSFLVGASSLLLKHGVKRKIRGYNCIELPEPFMFKITNPTARIVTISQRKWNPILPFAESLWLALGRNDLKFIGHYLKNMKNFSDDGFYLRGGYGPRLRKFDGQTNDYKSNFFKDKEHKNEVDQFDLVYKTFKNDINTRQGVITIGDPIKDGFDLTGGLKQTKDFPCTRVLHFQKKANENKLNLTVYMRSNDFLWGASAVNIFNFTFMLEYFSKILSLDIGYYYHIAGNFHYYENFETTIKEISKVKNYQDIGFKYDKSFNSLSEFDQLLVKLEIAEQELRTGNNKIFDFQDDFFNDWYKAFYVFNTKNRITFKNPLLNNLFKKYMKHG